jgi:hypothetical protein
VIRLSLTRHRHHHERVVEMALLLGRGRCLTSLSQRQMRAFSMRSATHSYTACRPCAMIGDRTRRAGQRTEEAAG